MTSTVDSGAQGHLFNLDQVAPQATAATSSDDEISFEMKTIEKERENASFPSAELSVALDGERYSQIKELVAWRIESDPALRDTSDVHDRTRQQARERTMEKIAHIVNLRAQREKELAEVEAAKAKEQADEPPRERRKKEKKEDEEEETPLFKQLADAFFENLSMADASWETRIGVHLGLFASAIAGNGDDQQRELYDKDIQALNIYGCFAMTELGHGSYVRGIETTATFIPEKDEIEIHSPTDTSLKWWIGAAATTATHAAVFARLLLPIKNSNNSAPQYKDEGVHCFVVQLRNTDTGFTLPGIEIGDCGAKMGRNGVDNGWIKFDRVRIPRNKMLQRHARLSADGTYAPSPKAQLSFGALIIGRVSVIQSCSNYAKKALTIAVRYSSIRRQFPEKEGSKAETQIIDYQTHQKKLLPALSTTFALHFTVAVIVKEATKYQREIEKLASNTQAKEEQALTQATLLSALNVLHATTAGLKALASWFTTNTIETCRQSLGGHGYSSYSNLPSIYNDFAVMCTWEGDNTVMTLQTARFLMSTLRATTGSQQAHDSQAGKSASAVGGFSRYLADPAKDLSLLSPWDRISPNSEIDNISLLLDAQRWVSLYFSYSVFQRMIALEQQGHPNAWNECSSDLVEAARLHCNYYMTHCFVEALSSKNVTSQSESTQKVLGRLCQLFALSNMEKDFGHYLEGGYLKHHHIASIRNQVRLLLASLRRDAVAIVDGWAIPDWVIGSPLGAKDGDIYRRYLAEVRKAPNSGPVPHYWDKLIRPLTERYVPKEPSRQYQYKKVKASAAPSLTKPDSKL